ncbi:MAG: type II secretion system protein GspN, partial [Deltaproteobacteria bacterium]|nr:type II secretion system protein GspN [Deltaproteobacteria bacterium]
PHILQSLKGEYGFALHGKAYKGEIKSTFHFSGGGKHLSAGEINLIDIKLEDYSFLNENFTHRIVGSLSGEIVYDGKSSDKVGGSGRADLLLSDGLLLFKEPVLNVTSVDLKEIKLEAQLSRRVITIMKAELEGSEINGSMTGSIQLQKDIGRSQINLKGTLEPLAAFYKKYPEIREVLKTMKKRVKRGQYFFTLTGTLGNPKFKLL